MRAATINTVIDDFNALLWEDKEFAIELIKKMFVEAKRDAIYKKSRSAVENLKKGKVKHGSVKDLYNDLEND
jgi:hypothetical protein